MATDEPLSGVGVETRLRGSGREHVIDCHHYVATGAAGDVLHGTPPEAAEEPSDTRYNPRKARRSPASPRDLPQTKPHHFGFRSGVNLDKLNHLVDELETGCVVARYRDDQQEWIPRA